jgi:hypothetical protein
MQFKPHKNLVAFCGYKGSGKDTGASVLIEEEGFTKVAFADALKGMLFAFFAYQDEYPTNAASAINGATKEKPHYLLRPELLGSDESIETMIDFLIMFQGHPTKYVRRVKSEMYRHWGEPALLGHSYNFVFKSLQDWAASLGQKGDWLTPRHVMQQLGTEWGRDVIDPEIWVILTDRRIDTLDKAVVTDVRFPNEEEYVRAKKGLFLRIDRSNIKPDMSHVSEQMVRDFKVDQEIENDKSIEALRAKVLSAYFDWQQMERIYG